MAIRGHRMGTHTFMNIIFLRSMYQIRYILMLLLILDAEGKGINTKAITPDEVTDITVSQSAITTLRFPDQVTGINGLGLIKKSNTTKEEEGNIQADLSVKGKDLVLCALDNNPVQMTIEMGGLLYVFNLSVGISPDVVVTLTTDAPASTDKNVKKVTPKEVADDRPKYNDELMSYWVTLAHEALLRKGSDPKEYAGYQSRSCNYIADDGMTTKTVVNRIHKFTDHDAIILDGTVTNEQSDTLTFDQKHVGVAIEDQMHAVTWMTDPEPIKPGETRPITVELVGDFDGSRANFSLSNGYRIEINTGYHKAQPTPAPTPEEKATPQSTPSLILPKKPRS